jgi:hypothetical protein
MGWASHWVELQNVVVKIGISARLVPIAMSKNACKCYLPINLHFRGLQFTYYDMI